MCFAYIDVHAPPLYHVFTDVGRSQIPWNYSYRNQHVGAGSRILVGRLHEQQGFITKKAECVLTC